MPKIHKGMVRERRKTFAKQITIKERFDSTSGLLKDRIHRNATRESEEKGIVWNEQLATEMVVLKFKPKLAHKSDIKATTMKTCVRNKCEGFVFEYKRQHYPHATFHTSMPPCMRFQECSLSDGHGDGMNLGDAHSLISALVLSPFDVKWGTFCSLEVRSACPLITFLTPLAEFRQA